MDDIVACLMAADMRAARAGIRMTVLRRATDPWHADEVASLVNGLMTEATQDPKHPGVVLLYGHFTKAETMRALGGGSAWTVEQITGADAAPWFPSAWCR